MSKQNKANTEANTNPDSYFIKRIDSGYAIFKVVNGSVQKVSEPDVLAITMSKLQILIRTELGL